MKMILDNRQITIREVADDVGIAYRSAHGKQLLRMFRHKSCGCEDCAKRTSHGHRSGDVDNVQRQSRFAQKAHNL